MIITFSKYKALTDLTLSTDGVLLSTNIYFGFFLHFKIIEKYLKATSGGYCKPNIVNVWEVDREMEVGTTVSLV